MQYTGFPVEKQGSLDKEERRKFSEGHSSIKEGYGDWSQRRET
jgi:hypothetical protein